MLDEVHNSELWEGGEGGMPAACTSCQLLIPGEKEEITRDCTTGGAGGGKLHQEEGGGGVGGGRRRLIRWPSPFSSFPLKSVVLTIHSLVPFPHNPIPLPLFPLLSSFLLLHSGCFPIPPAHVSVASPISVGIPSRSTCSILHFFT